MIDQLGHEPCLGRLLADLRGVRLVVGLGEGARSGGKSDDQCKTHEAQYVIARLRF